MVFDLLFLSSGFCLDIPDSELEIYLDATALVCNVLLFSSGTGPLQLFESVLQQPKLFVVVLNRLRSTAASGGKARGSPGGSFLGVAMEP